MTKIIQNENSNQIVIPISLEKPINLEEARLYHGHRVQVRGFLYPLSSGELILAHQPNLKSCCVGSRALINQQILIKGPLPESSYVVNLQGVFLIEPHYNPQKELTSLYTLQQAEAAHSNSDSSIFLIILILFFIIAMLIFLFQKVNYKKFWK